LADWTKGYFTEVQYTGRFFAQLAPGYLAFACLRQGVRPPKLGPGSAYLELGCGQGQTLNILAAANPQMSFMGVDFHPGQIANARRLAETAGLTNARFEDWSFEQMAAAPDPVAEKYDVIALHGIYSWVGPESRAAIVRILDRMLKPGGLVYVSYNALPGWATLQPLQHFIRAYAQRQPGDPRDAVVKALEAARDMAAGGAKFFAVTPALKSTIEKALGQDPAYLVHEYLHEGSSPQHHAEVVHDFRSARLEYAGTASQAEDFINLAVAEPLRPQVASAGDPVWRETLMDYANNKMFRRDIFVRGRNALSTRERDEQLAQVRLALLPAAEGTNFEFNVPLGRTAGDPRIYQPIVDTLAQGPRTYGEIAALPALAATDARVLYQAMAMLAGGGLIHPVNDEAVDAKPAQALNRAIIGDLAHEPGTANLAAPVVGGGVQANFVEVLGIGARLNGETDTAAAARGAALLAAAGRKMVVDGQELADGAPTEAHLIARLKQFETNRAPLFKALGVF